MRRTQAAADAATHGVEAQTGGLTSLTNLVLSAKHCLSHTFKNLFVENVAVVRTAAEFD